MLASAIHFRNAVNSLAFHVRLVVRMRRKTMQSKDANRQDRHS